MCAAEHAQLLRYVLAGSKQQISALFLLIMHCLAKARAHISCIESEYKLPVHCVA